MFVQSNKNDEIIPKCWIVALKPQVDSHIKDHQHYFISFCVGSPIRSQYLPDSEIKAF